MTSRNNNDRFKAGDQENSSQDSKSNTNSLLSFSVPTEFVDLPSKGLYYPEGHSLHNVSQVEIRHMTAKEEDILANQSLLKSGKAIDRMLQNVILTPDVDITDLLTGDKNAITVAARITGYGPEYSVDVTCPACGTKQKKSFDLSNSKIVGASFDRDTINEKLEGINVTDRGTFKVTLPASNFEAEFRMLTGKDEEKVESFANRATNSEKGSLLVDTISYMLVSVQDVTDYSQIREFVENMPAKDSKYLRNLYAKLKPDIDLTQEFVCRDCKHEQDLEVPITAEFFWPQS